MASSLEETEREDCKDSSDAASLVKFPRTEHVLDAGGSGVTRDDLLMDPADARIFYNGKLVAAVEEKVDGANLGISIDRDTMTVVAQNRSHFVNSATQAQFAQLDAWIDENRAALFELLVPGRHILFGEWLAAKHSIHYTHLPDRFLAFDIYDRKRGRFLSRERRDRGLDAVGIQRVPLVALRRFRSSGELLALLDSRSRFRDGPLEGVYLRLDEQPGLPREAAPDHVLLPPEEVPWGKYLARRGKIVRADFTQGITTHWTKMEMTKNVIDFGRAYAPSVREEEDGSDDV